MQKSVSIRVHLCLTIFLLFILAVTAIAADSVIKLDSRLELFADGRLIDRMDHARLQLNHPVLRENVFQFDAPWEGDASTYVTVFKDDHRFRMYYRGSSNSTEPREPAAAGCENFPVETR